MWDFVLEDARQLESKFGATDRRKLDEYMIAVRETEQRIEEAGKFAGSEPDYAGRRTFPKTTPSTFGKCTICWLYLSLLDWFGAPVDRIGDSTGRLPGLASRVGSDVRHGFVSKGEQSS